MPGPLGHTVLSSVFDNARPMNVSIETRPEAQEGYDTRASPFKKYALIYVVGEERDIVRYANLAGRDGTFDQRHDLDGWVDRYFYDTQLLTRAVPFAELLRRSRVNEAANAAGDAAGFPERSRASVPGTSP